MILPCPGDNNVHSAWTVSARAKFLHSDPALGFIQLEHARYTVSIWTVLPKFDAEKLCLFASPFHLACKLLNQLYKQYSRLWLLRTCACNARWQCTMRLTKRCTYTRRTSMPIIDHVTYLRPNSEATNIKRLRLGTGRMSQINYS